MSGGIVDSTPLRLAYADLLEAAGSVAETGATAPPPGEWNAHQLLAHLVAVDAGVLAAAWSVAAGMPATFDNRSSLDVSTLTRIAERVGDLTRLTGRVLAQGTALCSLTEQLTDSELDARVVTVLVSGRTLVVDEPLPLRDLVGGLAADHLPRHRQQLLALLPPDGG